MSQKLGTFIRIDFLLDQDNGILKMNETSILPFCGNHKFTWKTHDDWGNQVEHQKLIFDENVQKSLGDEFKNCFPFNSEKFQEMYTKSLSYTTPDPCRSHYK